jgi:DNA polymerase-3 subunit gamma/tau
MAAQVRYRKWRSQTFDEVIGQEHVTRTLRNALREGRIAHAYLFAGPRGTGKTSTARLLAKAVNCLQDDTSARPDNTCAVCLAINSGTLLDLIEIDAASNRGIDEIRDLRDKVHFVPSQARHKVYVIDEVHMLTPEAFNALLKTLEEPPPHVIFVLATTEPHRIPDTVLSRCQRFDFRRIPTHEIVSRLAFILVQEGRSAEPAALEMIARSAEGSMRDAISLTDQLLSYGGDAITEAQVQAVRGTISGQAIQELVSAMSQGDAATGLALINQLGAEGQDLRQLTIQLVEYLRAVLVARVSGQEAGAILIDLSPEHLAQIRAVAERFEAPDLAHAVRLLNTAAGDMRDAMQPQLTLELAWLATLQPGPAAAATTQADLVAPTSALPTISGEASSRGQGLSPMSASGPSTPYQHDVSRAPGKQHRPEAATLPAASSAVPDDQVVEVLRENWTTLLQAAEAARGGSLRGALRTLRHVVATGDDIYFAFESEFSKNTVERAANKAALQDLISQLLGRPIRLQCQVGHTVTGVHPAQLRAVESSPAQPAAGADELADDPVVEHALHHLGAVPGKVVKDRAQTTD